METKKILYFANIRLPTEKAHGIQIMKMCEALAENGSEVQLFLPTKPNPIKENAFDYYKVRKNFSIKKISTISLNIPCKVSFLIEYSVYSIMALFNSFFYEADIIYSRDFLVIYIISLFNKNTVWETHRGQKNFLVKNMLKRLKLVVCISYGLKKTYLELGIPEEKIIVSPDAVDFSEFNVKQSREECRKKLNLPLDKKLAMYAGHLYGWKGADVFAESTKYFSPNILAILIGGEKEDLIVFREKFKTNDNVLLLGAKFHSEIPFYLKAADVLILPNSAKSKISKTYTSPMKMFEYMASGVPIIASNLPSIREVLSEENAFFVEPDDSKSLGVAIDTVLNNNGLASEKARRAFEDVKQYTWYSRAEKILEFLK